MGKVNISEDILNEVEGLIDIDKHKTEGVESSAIFDGRQYTLKIPKRIADKIGINVDTDKFIFEVTTYPVEERKKPELVIRFKRGSE
ncbi:hypothetical protein KY366_05185 [Candidatus Woesearchaeota archaeon]|nr:hypothetical protein [Candidatus Woesearchaeota archaeon]